MALHGHIKRDLGALVSGLQQWLPNGPEVTGIRVLSAGHSNETFYIEGLDRVLRMPPSQGGLLPPYDMAHQHRVLAAVAGMPGGPPVPKVFELCENPEILGDPFFIMEALIGEEYEYASPPWLVAASERQREWMSTQWIDAVAALHDHPASAFPAPLKTARDYAEACLKMTQVPTADKRLVALLEGFVRNPPPASGPPTPVHGDPKIGNMMWRPDGSLVAVLDWEMAQTGEPLHDLGWMLCLYNQPLASAGLDLPGWLQQPAMVARWEARTGRSATSIEQYKVLAFAKIAAINTWGIWLYESGQTRDPRYAAWGEGMAVLLDILFSRAAKL